MDMEWLDNLLLQPIAAQTESTNYSPELEKLAKQRGFRSAEEMVLWENQRSQRRTPQTVKGQGAKKDSQPKQQAQPRTFGDILNTVSRALGGK
jgi:hypothetical protein